MVKLSGRKDIVEDSVFKMFQFLLFVDYGIPVLGSTLVSYVVAVNANDYRMDATLDNFTHNAHCLFVVHEYIANFNPSHILHISSMMCKFNKGLLLL